MRSVHATSTTRIPPRPLRDRLQVSEDLRTRLRHLLKADASCDRTVPDVLRQRSRPLRRGG